MFGHVCVVVVEIVWSVHTVCVVCVVLWGCLVVWTLVTVGVVCGCGSQSCFVMGIVTVGAECAECMLGACEYVRIGWWVCCVFCGHGLPFVWSGCVAMSCSVRCVLWWLRSV